MPFKYHGEIKYFTFDRLNTHNLCHGVFSRHGGVSLPPYATLNIGGSNGDRTEDVLENRRRLFESLTLDRCNYFDVWQVHSNRVIRTDFARRQGDHQEQADAIITSSPGLSLLMRFGDCVPIMLFDPAKNVIGIVHAGWIGTLKRVCENTVSKMTRQFLCNAEDIIACIGPSIAVDHYEVGEEVLLQFEEQFGTTARDFFVIPQRGKPHLDLWCANEYQLRRAGVSKIENSEICTACNYEDWFSHRQENGKTGRFGAIISLQETSDTYGN